MAPDRHSVNEKEFLSLLSFSGIALVLGIAGVLLFGLLLRLERSFSRWMVISVVPLAILGIALSSALSGRVLSFASANIESISAGGAGGGTGVLRLVTLAILGISVALIIGRLFAFRQPLSKQHQPLFLSFVAYFFANAVLNAAFGTVPEFVHNTMYAVVLFTAVYMCRDDPLERFIRAAKLGLVAMMLLSLVAAVVKPGLALQPSYEAGWIPGLRFRFWGLGSNPNSIGPLALLLLLLEWTNPSRQIWARALVVLPAVLVLFLAQSKTAWAAALLVGALIAWYRYGTKADGSTRVWLIIWALGLVALGVIALWAVDVATLTRRIGQTQVGTDVSTLTGRLQIWAAAIDMWRQNPFFGYGPSAWGPLHRFRIGIPFAFSAHNQFLDSVSSAGLLGLATLITYLALLGLAAVRAAAVTRAGSLALFLLLFVRTLTETPFNTNTIFSADLIAQLILFRFALAGSHTLLRGTKSAKLAAMQPIAPRASR